MERRREEGAVGCALFRIPAVIQGRRRNYYFVPPFDAMALVFWLICSAICRCWPMTPASPG